ncbi:MAG: type II toxin-antitoxin system VapC family toxin [Deltaproteobacteria bacterium]|nr:type II toxin-antitoxin system VapC family toxin [Deltaproteobacteria bacterium]
MIFVIDTSAAIEMILQREQANYLGKHVAESEWIITPSLYISEVTNVFWKYHIFRDMPIELCETAIENAVAIPDEFAHEKELYKESFALGCLTRKPIYDMLFLVLARRHNAYLMTMDKSLKQAAQKNSIRVI